MYPKIELHVHLEATVRPEILLEIARRNDYRLPADTAEGVADLYAYRDFRHFIEVWVLTTNALQREPDFRQMVGDYAAEAKSTAPSTSKGSSRQPSGYVGGRGRRARVCAWGARGA